MLIFLVILLCAFMFSVLVPTPAYVNYCSLVFRLTVWSQTIKEGPDVARDTHFETVPHPITMRCPTFCQKNTPYLLFFIFFI